MNEDIESKNRHFPQQECVYTMKSTSNLPHASHNTLVVFGYLREEYDKILPLDIKLLCCDFHGYSLCCIAVLNPTLVAREPNADFKPQSLHDSFEPHMLYNYRSIRDINSVSALFTSIIMHHSACFDHLYFERNLKFIEPTLNGNHSIAVASREGNHQCVESILMDKHNNMNNDTRIDKQNKYNGRTALWFASFFGHYNIVTLLIASSKRHQDEMQINLADSKGFSPLFVAAQNGHENVVKLLLENNADVNQREEKQHTPLWIASVRGHTNVVKLLLLQANIEIDCQDSSNVSPLWAACQNKHVAVVELLLNPAIRENNTRPQPANANLPKIDGCSPLWIAASEGAVSCMELLIKYGANINQSDTTSGATPLFVACQNAKEKAVHVLLKSKADVNIARQSDLTTALMVATHNGHIEIVEILLASGADIEAVNKHDTNALGFAAGQNHLEILRVLLDHFAGIRNTDEISDFMNRGDTIDGSTPLMLAASRGHNDVIKYLVHTVKVDVLQTDDENKTAREHAEENGHQSAVLWLKQRENEQLI